MGHFLAIILEIIGVCVEGGFRCVYVTCMVMHVARSLFLLNVFITLKGYHFCIFINAASL